MTDQENNNSGDGSDISSSNPFAALFGSVADAKQFAAVQKQQQLNQPPPAGELGGREKMTPEAAIRLFLQSLWVGPAPRPLHL